MELKFTFSAVNLLFRAVWRVPSPRVKTAWLLEMGLLGCPETSVTDHQSTLRNIPEEGRCRQCFDLIVWSVVSMLVVLLPFIFNVPVMSLLTGIFLRAGVRISSVAVCLRVGKCYTQLPKAEGTMERQHDRHQMISESLNLNVKLHFHQKLTNYILITIRILCGPG